MAPDKRESALKAAFTRELKHRLPYFYSLIHATRAAPDRSITGMGGTSLWEFKHATPHFDSDRDQELMCMRLAQAGFCRYVIWLEERNEKKTLIVHPRMVHTRQWKQQAEVWCEGFDQAFLVDYVLRIHRQWKQ